MGKDVDTDASVRLIRAHLARLSEHFDSVQIFATRQVGHMTDAIFDGAGNWYTRYGQIRAWMIAEEKDFDTSQRHEIDPEGEAD